MYVLNVEWRIRGIFGASIGFSGVAPPPVNALT